MKFKYSFMVLLGGTLYGTMSSFVKKSYADGFTAAELSFWQAFVAAIILAVCTAVSSKGRSEKLHCNEILPLMLTGSTIGLTNFLYYKSVQFIPASLAIILLMQFTWFSMLIEWFFLHRRPTRAEFIAVSVILVGTVMASGILSIESYSYSIMGIGLALLSSFTYGSYILANGQYGHNVRGEAKIYAIMLCPSHTFFVINDQLIHAGRSMTG